MSWLVPARCVNLYERFVRAIQCSIFPSPPWVFAPFPPGGGTAIHGDIHVGATLVVALGRHKACPYRVGTTPGREKTDRRGARKLNDPGDLFRQAAERDAHARATLAGLLLESLEHEVEEDVESAWQEEIERRLAEFDADSVRLVAWDEVKAKLISS